MFADIYIGEEVKVDGDAMAIKAFNGAVTITKRCTCIGCEVF